MSASSRPIRYNFGAGPKRVNGFKSVDALDWKGFTQIFWDLTKVPYEFAEENSADELLAIELLEHISFRDTMKVLIEWHRILKPGGKLTIQVPAIDKMCEMYTNGEVCDCVSHKPFTMEDARGKKECWSCSGKGKINPNRWLFAFTGAQKHNYDRHLNVFTKDILEDNLKQAGFTNIEIKYDKYEWKLIAVCSK